MASGNHDYERYGDVSKQYDNTRTPAGLEVVTGILYNHGIRFRNPINEAKLISLGCGTGNYEIELSRHVGKVNGIDISPEMIDRAKFKSASITSLDFTVGDAANLEHIADQSFDAAFFGLSLHHMGSYERQKQALRESYRVLKQRGLVVIQTVSEKQLRDGFWYFDLVPEATQRLIDRYLPIPDLIDTLRNTGFEYRGSTVPIDATLQGDAHSDVDGPFKPEWRAGISVWPLATKDELENALERLRRMKQDGTFDEYFKKREALRRDLGQMTFVYATK